MSALHAAAQGTVEQMALSLAGGTAVAACAWAALRLAPPQTSRARFALWFGVLISIALLPLLALVRGFSTFDGSASAAPHAWLTMPESWATYIFAFWAAIACAGLARVAAGLSQVHRVRASCEEISLGELPGCVRESLARFPARRPVSLCVSEAVRVPTAIGFFQPAVVMPRWLLAELPAAELNQVVLHELAHLARWDDWTNLAQKTLRAALFFHPAVWWIDQRLALEREMACDDAVIAATDDRHSYARCLAMLAEKTLGRRSAALAQAAVQRIQQVTARVVRILEPPGATRRGGGAYAIATVSALAVAGTFALGGGEPLIAFRAPAATLARTAVTPSLPSKVGSARLVPVAMRVAGPIKAPAHTIHRPRASAPDSGAPMQMANARQTRILAAQPLSPRVTANVIPAKAAATAQSPEPAMVVLTVFDASQDAQTWQLQVWRLTVYAPAPAAAAKPAPRKTT